MNFPRISKSLHILTGIIKSNAFTIIRKKICICGCSSPSNHFNQSKLKQITRLSARTPAWLGALCLCTYFPRQHRKFKGQTDRYRDKGSLSSDNIISAPEQEIFHDSELSLPQKNTDRFFYITTASGLIQSCVCELAACCSGTLFAAV